MPLSRRKLPLNALRAFEVAGRHCHLGLAAEELGVTHGAISRQVRRLEAQLGVSLFDRSRKRLSLTTAGQRLQASVGEALDHITESTLYLDPDSMSGSLVVATTPSISTGWLLGSIREFSSRYPEIEVRLVNLAPGQETLPPEVGVAVCFGEPRESRRDVRELFRERYFPVCSPALLAQGEGVNRPADLTRYPLIHDRHGRWKRWLGRHAPAATPAQQNLYLEEVFQALGAAREGCGVALADRIEVANDLRTGQLVALADETVEASQSHYLVTEQADRMTVRARLFADHVLRGVGARAL